MKSRSRILTAETPTKIGQSVELRGWVHARRNMGKIVFFDLRDRTGLAQIVVDPEQAEAYEVAKKIRPEFVIELQGKVKKREPRNVKPTPTGGIEVHAESISILSESETPPFEIDRERDVTEEIRLKYRYLDLRRDHLRHNLLMRHKVLQFLRRYLGERDFIEIQTPILTKSTPEGARDFLVPSRLNRGKFFALPQSPQQYKQLLMVAGFERYFQIAPCFRDEDARVDRSPGEFYQLDMEMSFITQDEILELTETMLTEMVRTLFPEKRMMQTPWPRLDWAETVAEYGTDKPDLRKDKTDKDELAFAWVVNFPLFNKQTREDFFHGAGQNLAPSHHMFTAPRESDIPLLDTEPAKARALQHDLVLNGIEVGGGSIRIHRPEIQEKVFDIIGFTPEQKKQFNHLLTAFKYGVPPHGGIAPGIERLLMAILGEPNVKEVIAFPLTSEGRDPLMGAPAKVARGQLDDLGIMLKPKP